MDFEKKYVRPTPGPVLIVGSRVYPGREDARAKYEYAVGIDMVPGHGVDMVLDLEEPIPAYVGTFSHICCRSVLEHSRRPWLLAANIERLMLPGATLHVDAPTVWRFHGYPSDYWRFTHAGIVALFPRIEWAVLRYSRDNGRFSHPPRIPRGEDGRYGRVQIHGFGHAR